MSDADNDLSHEPEIEENTEIRSDNDRDENDGAIEYSSAVHINSPLDRSLRNDTAAFVATFDPIGSAGDANGQIRDALAAASKITDENERLPHKTQFSSGDHAKRIAQIRKKRIPSTSIAKELSRMPPNKSDAETGLEVGKHTWRGLVAGVMSARKDAEAKKDAKLAEELEEAKQAKKELDRREQEDEKSQENAKKTVSSKADARGQDGPDGSSDGNGGPDGGTGGGSSEIEKKSNEKESLGKDSGIATKAGDPLLEKAAAAAKDIGLAAAKTAAPIAIGLPQEAAVRTIADTVKTAAPIVQGSELQATPPAKNMTAAERTGPLFAQARSFPKVSEPVRAIGPANPPPRARAQGMGIGFASLIKAARALATREQSDLSAAAWMQKRRDHDGLSR